MKVLVEHPIGEAKALLKLLGPGRPAMSAEEWDMAEEGRKRIERAVAVERPINSGVPRSALRGVVG